MFRLTLRKKLIFYSIILAIIPLGIAGRTMITITQDELKSAANDDLSVTADQLAEEIDDFYTDTWLAPLLLLRNNIDNEEIDVKGKISLLTSIQGLVDIVSLQLTVEGIAEPFLVTQDDFTARLKAASLGPSTTLKLPPDEVAELQKVDGVGDQTYIPEVDTWLITTIIPLNNKISERSATLSARISLDRLKDRIENHPFTKTGSITLVDVDGRKIFDPERSDLSRLKVVQAATELLKTGSRAIGVQPYTRPSGENMLGAFSFPKNLEWAVISEKNETDAYLAVAKMSRSLIFWALIGFLVAVAVGIFVSHRISRPLMEISEVAQMVGKGDFGTLASMLKPGDEIGGTERRAGTGQQDEVGQLREHFNTMVSEVYQREETLKRRVQELEIAIDEEKRKEQVEEIVGTDFFRDLRQKAKVMRARRTGEETSDT
ncbi:HAMP domain-containing protein [Candidatus Poribacteria bacterium]